MKREVLRRALPVALCLCAVAGVVASSCSNTQNINTGGDFSSPTGVATVSATDRDFLVVANAGSSELRAVNICINFPDGGSPGTCPSNQDFTFVPGPIRVFPASFPVATRPLRIAGVSLDTGASRGGTILIAGSPTTPSPLLDGGVPGAVDGGAVNAIFAVDSNDMLAVEFGTEKAMPPPGRVLLDTPAIDVIAADTPANPKLAFALTLGEGAVKSQIVVMTATLTGTRTTIAQTARCTLDIVGAKLALVPGSVSKLYVADATPNGVVGGIGDGALELDVAAILALGVSSPPAACPAGRRIPATDTYATPPRPRPLTALALNPQVVTDIHASIQADGGVALCPDGNLPPGPGDLCTPQVLYAAGEMLLGVTGSSGAALDPTDPTSGKEAGRLVFLRTVTADMAPIPPYDFHDTGRPPMKPIAVNGLAREVAFLTPPPREKCPTQFPDRPCGIIYLVLGGSRPYGLAAVATSTDGATYFIEANARRFFNDARDYTNGITTLGPVPLIDTLPYLSPPSAVGVTDVPTLNFASGDAVRDADGGVIPSADGGSTPLPGGRPDSLITAGVSRKSRWTVTYHGTISGVERRTGTIFKNSTGDGFHVDLPNAQLDKIASLSASCGKPNRYCLGLGVGDYASFYIFSARPGDPPLCQELVDENTRAARELRIDAFTANSMELGVEPNPLSTGSFASLPASCFPAAVSLEARAGEGLGNRPWVVQQGVEQRGRTGFNEQFFGYEPRFDYPLDLPLGSTTLTPAFTEDVGVSFIITGGAPSPKSSFLFGVSSGQGQTSTRDPSSVFAGAINIYNSVKITNLVFTAVTGANEVLQSDPAFIGALNGTIAYR